MDDEAVFDLNETNQIESQGQKLQVVDDNSILANLNSAENVGTRNDESTNNKKLNADEAGNNKINKIVKSQPSVEANSTGQSTISHTPLYYELRIKLKEGKNLAV